METKPFYLIAILVLSTYMAIGQGTDNAKTSFGILGGINFQNLNGKNALGNSLENDMIIGFHVGANIQIPIVPEFYFQPGLLFSTKGAENTTGSTTSKYSLSYLELPLNFVYKGLLGKGYVMLGLGPYVGYAIGGKAKFDDGTNNTEMDIEFQNVVEQGEPITAVYLKAMDAGGNIFAGYETAGGLFGLLNAQFGMLKINPEDKRIPDDKTSVKNTGFGISVGYRF